MRLRGPAHDDRLADQLDVAALVRMHGLGEPELAHLRVGEHLIDGVDRPARHPGLVQQLDPVRAGLATQDRGELGVQRIAVLRAVGRRRVRGVLGQLLVADRAAKASPDLLTRDRDVDVAVAGREHAGRDAGRMIVAGLLGYVVIDQPARRLEVQHEHLRLQQRGLDPLALARVLALEQRDQNALRREQAGAQIGDRDADPHGALPGQAGDRHQPAEPLRDLIEPRPFGVRAVLAEAGDAGEHDPRIDRPEVVVADPEPLLDVGPEVLDHDVRALDHPQQDLAPGLRLEVEGQAALVAVQVLEVGAGARAAQRMAVRPWVGHLDLDHVGAPVGQLAHAGGAGAHPGEVEHGEARERRARRQMGHGGALLQGLHDLR